MARVTLLGDKLADKALVARRPADREPPSDLALYLLNLIIELAASEALDGSSGNGIHRRVLEKPDRLVHVVREDRWRKRHLGKRLRNSNDGFELTKDDNDNMRSGLSPQ